MSWLAPRLAELLAPGDVETFLDRAWDRGPLHVHAANPRRLEGLLSVADIEELVTSSDGAGGWAGVVRGQVRRPGADMVGPDGTLSIAPMATALSSGASLVLNRLHARRRRVAALCDAVAADLRQAGVRLRRRVGANAYLSPPGGAGLDVHADDHDVLVLQLAGAKRWTLFARGSADCPVDVAEEIEIRRGDVLYLPRRTAHRATATGYELSLHLTLGIHPVVVRDVAVAALRATTRLDAALPVGAAPDAVLRLLEGGLAGADVETALDSLEETFVASISRPSGGAFATATGLDAVTLDATLVRRRDLPVLLRSGCGTDMVVLHAPDTCIELSAPVAPALAVALRGQPFRLADLPGVGDEARVALGRLLVREGILEAVST